MLKTVLFPAIGLILLSIPLAASADQCVNLTLMLALGSRGSDVVLLQQFLIAQNDLAAGYATGYYGALTQAAVKKFQCAQNIVCSGTPATTGWGRIGPKTRAVIAVLSCTITTVTPSPLPVPPPPPPVLLPTPIPTPNPVLSPPLPTNAFKGDYFKDQNLTTLAISRTDAAVNFMWDSGSPDPTVAADHFSARWEGSWNFITGGTYRFYATASDGIRVYIDGTLLIDQWHDGSETSYTADTSVTAGVHDIKVEYYNNTGDATAIVSWSLVPSELIAREKSAGCTADGLLWGGTDELFGRSGIADLADYESSVAKSNCVLLDRSIETWASPPNFDMVQSRINTISSLSGGKNFIYSLNIAEDIMPSVDSYYDPLSGRLLNFSAMCVPGSTNAHGQGSDCVPEFRNAEYQQYLKSITQRSMDLGARDFIFGAMDWQDSQNFSAPTHQANVDTDLWTAPAFPQIFAAVRAYAFQKGVPITIGCQFEKSDRNYANYFHLKLCDYKYSPLMTSVVDPTAWGAAQWDNPASAADWSNGDWNNATITSQTNVLADFEWWGAGDDITRYIQQPKQERMLFVWNAYNMLHGAGQGLLLPFGEPLIMRVNGAQCSYPSQADGTDPQYSSSDKYCGDDDEMNAAMAGNPVFITADQHHVPSGGSTFIRWYTPTPNTCTVYSGPYALWLSSKYGNTSTYGPLQSDTGYQLRCPDGSNAQTTVQVP
jgi:hypothetical protein